MLDLKSTKKSLTVILLHPVSAYFRALDSSFNCQREHVKTNQHSGEFGCPNLLILGKSIVRSICTKTQLSLSPLHANWVAILHTRDSSIDSSPRLNPLSLKTNSESPIPRASTASKNSQKAHAQSISHNSPAPRTQTQTLNPKPGPQKPRPLRQCNCITITKSWSEQAIGQAIQKNAKDRKKAELWEVGGSTRMK